MSPTTQKILQDALRLSESERVSLAAELLGSLEPHSSGQQRTEKEWLAEVERRARAALSGTPGLTWDETLKRVTDRLPRR
jgi:putative addiction module component (TIGR02574 family)